MYFVAVKPLDFVTVGYCDTYAIPRQCHNIQEALSHVAEPEECGLFGLPPPH